MSDRFYCPEGFAAENVELDGAEAHHLAGVLRAKPGQQVRVFDGLGHEAVAEITSIERRRVNLRIVSRSDVPPEFRREIVLAIAAPKGDRFRWLVEKATELGVAEIIPLITERSVVEPGSGKLDKARQVVIEACKQSGRNRLLRIHETLTWNEFVASMAPPGVSWIAHPGGPPIHSCDTDWKDASRIVAAVGPEGGFTDEEFAQAVAAGMQPVSLGPRILRVETAGLFLASLLA